jgi:deoxyribodipyrimidine photo-lyase
MSDARTAFWFRRDLRLDDNAGLFHALTEGQAVVPVFIFDRHILDPLPSHDARVEFLLHRLQALQAQLTQLGSTLVVRYGYPEQLWPELLGEFDLQAVYTNQDYEPYARKRDGELEHLLREQGVVFRRFRDQVIFEKDEVLTNGGKPYSVFSPYARKWRAQLDADRRRSYDTEAHFDGFFSHAALELPSLAQMGFAPTEIAIPTSEPNQEIIRHYEERRNFPAIEGTTRLGIHLRHGTISIRKLLRLAQSLSDTYVSELIWREFYMQILWNFPHVAEKPFRPEYEAIPWRDDEEAFEKWKAGQTGYPIVDAAMREIAATGYMHNRSRMIAASFLTKHLLINWQWGEAYFAEKLLDFELSSNNGGWQWAAGCGTDAAPYFRVFNPESQMKKFDPELKYVRRWVPEYGTPAYPRPIVEHKMARQRCLDTYKQALDQAKG